MMDAAASGEKGREMETGQWSERHDARIRAEVYAECAKIAHEYTESLPPEDAWVALLIEHAILERGKAGRG